MGMKGEMEGDVEKRGKKCGMGKRMIVENSAPESNSHVQTLPSLRPISKLLFYFQIEV
jgi:hypothetical protein